MPVAYKAWELSPAEQQKFQDWLQRILTGHTGTKDVRNAQIHWTPPGKPLSECVVGLMTTSGVHLKSDTPFDVANPHGDWSFREVSTNVETTITHTHYNHVDADRDVNCMFPLDRLRELCDQGVIATLHPPPTPAWGLIQTRCIW